MSKARSGNVCLTDKVCELSFMIHHDLPGTSMIENMSEKLQDVFYDPAESYATINVAGIPLWELLDKHNAPKIIDYLSLDVEGAEWMVLRDFPFDQYTFRCMTIERGADNYLELRELLFANSYRIVKIGGADDYWVHESTKYTPPAARPNPRRSSRGGRGPADTAADRATDSCVLQALALAR